MKQRLPCPAYRAEQVRSFDQILIEELDIPGIALMERAGSAAFQQLRHHWPAARRITLVCGTGNNGGDGFIVGRLALESGLHVRLLQLGDGGKLSGDALTSANAFVAAGGQVLPFQELDAAADLIVDAIFGTGLEREVTGLWRVAIEAMNHHPAPKMALDIPSGLQADTGATLGVAVQATATISFIALKQGLYSGQGPGYCGEISFNDLGAPASLYQREPVSSYLWDWAYCADLLQPRSRTAHKGDFGHLLLVGGELGYSGAIRLAAEAGLRSGAGLVSVATRQAHAAILTSQRPELMCRGIESAAALDPLIKRAGVIGIGPGLGQGGWGMAMLQRVIDCTVPLVIDADALNLLAQEPLRRDNWVLTPHPGEAARLLQATVAQVQSDRFAAVVELQARYGGVILLKGAGTLVCGPSERPVAICTDGNPGMASGGMGDLLTGIIAALIAQGVAAEMAALMGGCLHGAAADLAAAKGERGLLASDLLPCLRQLLNPKEQVC